jgi:hypothetical protein
VAAHWARRYDSRGVNRPAAIGACANTLVARALATLLGHIDRTKLQDVSAADCVLALGLITEVQAQQHNVDRTEAALRFSDAKLALLTHEMPYLSAGSLPPEARSSVTSSKACSMRPSTAIWQPSNSS